MKTSTQKKVPLWYWIVTILAILWNIMGVSAYLFDAFMTPEQKMMLPAEQLELMNSTPSWVTAAYAIAVWSGLTGSIGLAFRKKWAKGVLLISLIAVVLQLGYVALATNAMEVYGQFEAVILPMSVLVIAIMLLILATRALKNKWIT